MVPQLTWQGGPILGSGWRGRGGRETRPPPLRARGGGGSANGQGNTVRVQVRGCTAEGLGGPGGRLSRPQAQGHTSVDRIRGPPQLEHHHTPWTRRTCAQKHLCVRVSHARRRRRTRHAMEQARGGRPQISRRARRAGLNAGPPAHLARRPKPRLWLAGYWRGPAGEVLGRPHRLVRRCRRALGECARCVALKRGACSIQAQHALSVESTKNIRIVSTDP